MHAFDGRTDRQPDGQTDRILFYTPWLTSMQRGTKWSVGLHISKQQSYSQRRKEVSGLDILSELLRKLSQRTHD